jgi:hypothetical protein
LTVPVQALPHVVEIDVEVLESPHPNTRTRTSARRARSADPVD